MTSQTPDRPSKSFSASQESNPNRRPMVQQQDQGKRKQGSYHVPERMETFPKTRTFPKKWDFSSFTKDTK